MNRNRERDLWRDRLCRAIDSELAGWEFDEAQRQRVRARMETAGSAPADAPAPAPRAAAPRRWQNWGAWGAAAAVLLTCLVWDSLPPPAAPPAAPLMDAALPMKSEPPAALTIESALGAQSAEPDTSDRRTGAADLAVAPADRLMTAAPQSHSAAGQAEPDVTWHAVWEPDACLVLTGPVPAATPYLTITASAGEELLAQWSGAAADLTAPDGQIRLTLPEAAADDATQPLTVQIWAASDLMVTPVLLATVTIPAPAAAPGS